MAYYTRMGHLTDLKTPPPNVAAASKPSYDAATACSSQIPTHCRHELAAPGAGCHDRRARGLVVGGPLPAQHVRVPGSWAAAPVPGRSVHDAVQRYGSTVL